VGVVAVAQGLYYRVTGVWPLVNLRTFEAITGPKRDKWLVRTVGILAAAIGTGLWTGLRRNLQPEVELIGVATPSGSGRSRPCMQVEASSPGFT
jgi:hypothetical protein